MLLQIFQCERDGNFVPETQLSRVEMLSSDDIVPETQRDENGDLWSDVDDDLLALVLTPVKDPEKRKEAEVYVIIGDEVGDPGEHMSRDQYQDQRTSIDKLTEYTGANFVLGHHTPGMALNLEKLLRYSDGYLDHIFKMIAGDEPSEVLPWDRLTRRLKHLCTIAFTLNVELRIEISPSALVDTKAHYSLDVIRQQPAQWLDRDIRGVIGMMREDDIAKTQSLQNRFGSAGMTPEKYIDLTQGSAPDIDKTPSTLDRGFAITPSGKTHGQSQASTPARISRTQVPKTLFGKAQGQPEKSSTVPKETGKPGSNKSTPTKKDLQEVKSPASPQEPQDTLEADDEEDDDEDPQIKGQEFRKLYKLDRNNALQLPIRVGSKFFNVRTKKTKVPYYRVTAAEILRRASPPEWYPRTSLERYVRRERSNYSDFLNAVIKLAPEQSSTAPADPVKWTFFTELLEAEGTLMAVDFFKILDACPRPEPCDEMVRKSVLRVFDKFLEFQKTNTEMEARTHTAGYLLMLIIIGEFYRYYTGVKYPGLATLIQRKTAQLSSSATEQGGYLAPDKPSSGKPRGRASLKAKEKMKEKEAEKEKEESKKENYEERLTGVIMKKSKKAKTPQQRQIEDRMKDMWSTPSESDEGGVLESGAKVSAELHQLMQKPARKTKSVAQQVTLPKRKRPAYIVEYDEDDDDDDFSDNSQPPPVKKPYTGRGKGLGKKSGINYAPAPAAQIITGQDKKRKELLTIRLPAVKEAAKKVGTGIRRISSDTIRRLQNYKKQSKMSTEVPSSGSAGSSNVIVITPEKANPTSESSEVIVKAEVHAPDVADIPASPLERSLVRPIVREVVDESILTTVREVIAEATEHARKEQESNLLWVQDESDPEVEMKIRFVEPSGSELMTQEYIDYSLKEIKREEGLPDTYDDTVPMIDAENVLATPEAGISNSGVIIPPPPDFADDKGDDSSDLEILDVVEAHPISYTGRKVKSEPAETAATDDSRKAGETSSVAPQSTAQSEDATETSAPDNNRKAGETSSVAPQSTAQSEEPGEDAGELHPTDEVVSTTTENQSVSKTTTVLPSTSVDDDKEEEQSAGELHGEDVVPSTSVDDAASHSVEGLQELPDSSSVQTSTITAEERSGPVITSPVPVTSTVSQSEEESSSVEEEMTPQKQILKRGLYPVVIVRRVPPELFADFDPGTPITQMLGLLDDYSPSQEPTRAPPEVIREVIRRDIFNLRNSSLAKSLKRDLRK